MQVRSIICPKIRKIKFETKEIPDKPGPHEIIVKTVCSLISAGTELAVYSGSHIGYSLPNSPFPKLPWSVGYSSAGIVYAVGKQVQGFNKNDRVAIIAPHADYTLCDIRNSVVRPLPPNVTFEQGALARLGGISLLGVLHARIAIGETVVVFGLGLIGHFAAQLCLINGARPVIGVDLYDKRIQIANGFGIKTINGNQQNIKLKILELTNGHRPQIILESTGNPEIIEEALRLAADGGRVIELGSPRGTAKIDVYSTIHRNALNFSGVHDRLAPLSTIFPHLRTRHENLELILKLFEDGSLKSENIISNYIKPEEIQDSYEKLLKDPSNFMGVLIEWEQA